MSEEKQKPLWIPQVIVIAVIGFGLLIEGEGGYFNLARWIVCPAMAFLAYRFADAKKVAWAWVFGVLAGVFNPIVPVHMDRDVWLVVDWVVMGACIAAIGEQNRNRRNK